SFMLQLNTETRNIFGKKLKNSKKEGKIPAVVYGKGKESKPLFVNLNEFKKIWKNIEEATIVKLNGCSSDEVLVYDTEKDPVRGEFIHVDFYALDVDKPITADVKIIYEGVSPAVKEKGGVLVKVLHTLEIEALPKDFPHEIKIDVSKLINIGARIIVKALVFGKSVKVNSKDDQIIVLAKPHAEEKVDETPRTIEDVELSEKKGKKEEEGEEGAVVAEAKKEGKK
ncbi:MAG: 50S ribosomal protein L25, partial [Patescibacteria group bacterium]